MKADILLEVVRPELQTLLVNMDTAVISLRGMLWTPEFDFSDSASRLKAAIERFDIKVIRSERSEFLSLNPVQAKALGSLLGRVPRLASTLRVLSDLTYEGLPTAMLFAEVNVEDEFKAVAQDIASALASVDPPRMSRLSTPGLFELWNERLLQQSAARHMATIASQPGIWRE